MQMLLWIWLPKYITAPPINFTRSPSDCSNWNGSFYSIIAPAPPLVSSRRNVAANLSGLDRRGDVYDPPLTSIKLRQVPLDFSKFQAVLLDLDGTIYHEDHVLPGAVDLVARLQRENRPFACLTNSTTSASRLVQRLSRMGIQIGEDRVYTAGRAAAD